jgi:hypothetical protein
VGCKGGLKKLNPIRPTGKDKQIYGLLKGHPMVSVMNREKELRGKMSICRNIVAFFLE